MKSEASLPKGTPRQEEWWNRLEIRHLRFFVAIAEEMNFGRAALRLHVAQPALSRHIARLEGDLGGLLFDRTRSQIKLTAAGAALLPMARELLQRLGELAEVTRKVAAGRQGVLSIGFISSATFSVLPEILKGHREQYPGVDLQLHHMLRAELVHALVERRVQFAFTRAPIDDPEISSELVSRERMMIAMPVGDPLLQSEKLSLGMLTKRSFILPKVVTEHSLLKLSQEAGFMPRVAEDTIDLQTGLTLVSAGMGLALVPESAQHSYRGGIVYRLLDDPPLYTEFMLSYRKDNLDPLLQSFRESVQRYRARKESEETVSAG